MELVEVKVFSDGVYKLPRYETEFAAGMDLKADFSKIKDGMDFMGDGETFIYDSDTKTVTLAGHGGRILLPTNLYVAIPDGYEIQIRPRSGLALKHGITVLNSPGTIDCVPKGTLIKTIDGYKKVEDIYNIDKQTILSYNEETTKLEEDVITDMWIVNDVELVKITLDNNKTITIPLSKKVYTKNGWKSVSDLNENDEILNLG